jgi:hypothetical protein
LPSIDTETAVILAENLPPNIFLVNASSEIFRGSEHVGHFKHFSKVFLDFLRGIRQCTPRILIDAPEFS